MKFKTLLLTSVALLLATSCGNEGGNVSPTTSSSEPTSTSVTPKEGQDIDFPNSFPHMANSSLAANYVFRYNSTTKVMSAKYYDNLKDFLAGNQNASKSFEKEVKFEYTDELVYLNSYMTFSNADTKFSVYYTAGDDNVNHRGDLKIMVSNGGIFSFADFCSNNDDRYKIDTINGLLAGEYYSKEKLHIRNQLQQESDMYVRVTFDDQKRVKTEISEDAEFTSPATLDDFTSFETLIASAAISSNGSRLLEHLLDSGKQALKFQKVSSNDSKSVIPNAIFVMK